MLAKLKICSSFWRNVSSNCQGRSLVRTCSWHLNTFFSSTTYIKFCLKVPIYFSNCGGNFDWLIVWWLRKNARYCWWNRSDRKSSQSQLTSFLNSNFVTSFYFSSTSMFQPKAYMSVQGLLREKFFLSDKHKFCLLHFEWKPNRLKVAKFAFSIEKSRYSKMYYLKKTSLNVSINIWTDVAILLDGP